MSQMYLRDGHVYTTWSEPPRDDGLVVSRHDLAAEIGYINTHGIEYVDVATGNPRIYVDRAFLEARLQELQSAGNAEPTADYPTDITPLRSCPQLSQLSLSGNVTHAEVLVELPNLRVLSLDNSLGKHPVDLSGLALHTLYMQKPGRNVRGYEQIVTLRELVIWNYQPKSRDLTELHRLTNLRILRLIQPRISTLEGAEQLPALTKLNISYARTLTDASAIERFERPLEVALDHVPDLGRK